MTRKPSWYPFETENVKLKNSTLKGQAALHPKLVAKKQREILNQRPRKPPDTHFRAKIVELKNLTLKSQTALHPKTVAKKQREIMI